MAYINGNKPTVTNGLIYALDFSNTKTNSTGNRSNNAIYSNSGIYCTISQSRSLTLPQFSLDPYGNKFLTFSASGDTARLDNTGTAFQSPPPFSTQWGTPTGSYTLIAVVAPGGLAGNSMFAYNPNTGGGVSTSLGTDKFTAGYITSYVPGGNYNRLSYNAAITQSRFQIIAYRYDNASANYFLNGTPIPAATGDVLAYNGGVTSANRAFTLSGRNDDTNGPGYSGTWSGSLSVLNLYNRALTWDEILIVSSQLGRRFNIPIYTRTNSYDENTLLFASASAITSSTILDAVDTFVKGLKTNNLWNRLRYAYPFIGGTSGSNSINLANPSTGIGNLAFVNGWTHSPSGSTPTTSASFISSSNTGIFEVEDLLSYNTSQHMAYASYDLPTTSSVLIGSVNLPTMSVALTATETGISAAMKTLISSSITGSSSNIGLVIGNRISGSVSTVYRNGVSSSVVAPITGAAYVSSAGLGIIGAANVTANGYTARATASYNSPYNVVYASYGAGFSDSELNTYNNLVGQLQTNLKRKNTLLDNYSGAAAAYSLRRIGPSGYFGPAIRVRRDSDNTLRDIGFTSDGQLDTVGLLDFVGVTGSGFVQTWYDQSGNGYNATQATTTAQPFIVTSGSIERSQNKNTIRTFTGGFVESAALPAFDYFSFYSLVTPITTGGSSQASYVGLGTAGGSYKLFFGYGPTQPQTLFFNKGGSGRNTSISMVNDVRKLITADANFDNVLFSLDGVLNNTQNITGTTSGGTNVKIGNGYGNETKPSLHQELILYTSSRRDISNNLNTSILSAYTTGSDTDYQAFITATGITQPTQSAALETLVSDLKSYGLWNKMKAIYPMITDKNNRFAYSQALGTTWNATNVYVTQSFTTAPDGTLTGNFVSESAVTDSHYIYQTIADGLVTGSEYVASVHGRFLNRPWIAIETNTGAKAWFNIQTGITGSLTGSNATITAVSGGWYRCALYFTSSVASGPQNIQYNLADADGNLSYAGVAGTGSYLWGAQFENGNVLGPYRATTATGFTTGSMLDQMKFNLKNTGSFSGSYFGGWNPGYSGNKPDGTTGYMNTGLNLLTNYGTSFSNHFSLLYRTDNVNAEKVGAAGGASPQYENGMSAHIVYDNTLTYNDNLGRNSVSNASYGTSRAYHISTVTSTTSQKLYRNGIVKIDGSSNSGRAYPSLNFVFGAYNFNNTIQNFSNRESAFATIGDGLTDYEAKALYWIVQKYQTTLGRQVY